MHDPAFLELIDACLRGHAPSEKALFTRFAQGTMAIARRFAADEPQALDYLQECWIVIFDKLRLFDPEKGSFQGWISKISVRVILQCLRKNKHKIQLLEFPAELPEAELEASDLQHIPPEKVLDAVRQLPEGYRTVFNLYVFDNWSHRDIAQSLGIAESASRSQLARAKQQLKSQLQQVLRQYEQGLV